MIETIALTELDGYEFLVTEDSNAVVEFEYDPHRLGHDGTHLVFHSVTFRGEDVLPRLTDLQKDYFVEEIISRQQQDYDECSKCTCRPQCGGDC